MPRENHVQDANEPIQNQLLHRLIVTLFIQRNLSRSQPSFYNYLTLEHLNLILDYLGSNTVPVLSRNQCLLFQGMPNSPTFLKAQHDYLSSQLRHLVAAESEDNLKKVQSFLLNHERIAATLIASKGTLIDAANRRFEERSAYGYLYWAGDAALLKVLDEFIDERSKQAVNLECERIHQQGLDFKQNDFLITRSRFFSMTGILNAALEYYTAAKLLSDQKNWHRSAWKPVQRLWFKLGHEQSNVPLWIAQVFCSNSNSLESFNSINARRTTIFTNLSSYDRQYWFFNGKPNPNLGVSIAIQRYEDRVWGITLPSTKGVKQTRNDILMMADMHRYLLNLYKERLKKLSAGIQETESSFAGANLG